MYISQSQKQRIAIVIPDLRFGGGVRTMGKFIYETVQKSDRYTADIISVSTSAKDEASIRIVAPKTWLKGIQCHKSVWENVTYTHVGAVLTEIEFQRYRPHRTLTNLLNQYDLIQLISGTPAIGMLATRSRKPTCLFVATTVYQERMSVLRQLSGFISNWVRLMTWFATKFEYIALNKMTHVFAESIYTRQLLAPIVDERKLSIGVPGISTKVFYPLSSYPSESYILSVGRFSDPRKNVTMLLTAYHELIQKVERFPRLVLAGLGGLPDEGYTLAKKLGIADYLDVYANISVEKLAELYRNASMFVLSSNEEGLGIVILEAMASGIPVVSTRCGGPETAVVDGETGFLTPIGNARQFAEKMSLLLSRPSLRKLMGKQARDIVEKKFSLRAAGDVYLQKYDEILNSKETIH